MFTPRVAETTGGVAPLGFPAPILTLVDIDLANFDEVWAAGGHPHYVFPTSFDELVRITGGTPALTLFSVHLQNYIIY